VCRYALEVFPNSSGLGEFADYSDQADCANCADALAFAKFAYFFGNTLLKTRPPALPRKWMLWGNQTNPKAALGRNKMDIVEGRAAVASVGTENTATTERGPPGQMNTSAQNAHKFRRKWREALRSRPLALRTRPRRSVALQVGPN